MLSKTRKRTPLSYVPFLFQKFQEVRRTWILLQIPLPSVCLTSIRIRRIWTPCNTPIILFRMWTCLSLWFSWKTVPTITFSPSISRILSIIQFLMITAVFWTWTGLRLIRLRRTIRTVIPFIHTFFLKTLYPLMFPFLQSRRTEKTIQLWITF